MGVGTAVSGPELVTCGVESWPHPVSASAATPAMRPAIFAPAPGFDFPVDISLADFLRIFYGTILTWRCAERAGPLE